MTSPRYDAVVIGAGHNGLTCACYLAKAGMSVLVLEANEFIGGLTITREITRPGFHSDLHAFGYQFASLSPAPEELTLGRHRLELLTPEISFAHAFPDGATVQMHTKLDRTCESIASHSPRDAARWRVLFERWLAAKDAIRAGLNGPPGPLSARLGEMEGTPGGLDEYRFESGSLWTLGSTITPHAASRRAPTRARALGRWPYERRRCPPESAVRGGPADLRKVHRHRTRGKCRYPARRSSTR